MKDYNRNLQEARAHLEAALALAVRVNDIDAITRLKKMISECNNLQIGM